MAIQNRRGPYKKLDTTKLKPGEYAIVLQDDPFCADGKAVYICFKAGDTKRMATYEDMKENIINATEEIIAVMREATEDANEAAGFANAVGEDLIARREAGEFTGPKGADGVVTVTKGQVAFQVINDHLFLYYHDGDEEPNYSINGNGHLIMNIGGNA